MCVMTDGQAGQLVDHACRVYLSDIHPHSRPLRVLHLDTVASRLASAEMKADLAHALARAQARGAEIVRQSLAVDTAHHLISTIVHQARAARARHILLGNQAMGQRYWANFGERISDFAEVLAASLPNLEIEILVAPSRAPRFRPPRPAWNDQLQDLLAPSRWALPVAVVAVCTLLSAFVAQRLHPINLLLLFLVGVLYVALKRGLLESVITVVLSVLVYDWIFVAPRWSFKPTDPEYFFTFAIMLGVGLVAGRLAARSRDASLHALAQANRAQALSLLAQNMAKARSPADIAQVVAVAVERTLFARASLSETGSGEVPDGAKVFELMAGGGSQGRLLVWDLSPEHRGVEDLHLLQAFADQAAVAIERYRHERRSAERAIEAETERVRNTLLAGISHDFRTPLTTIIGAVSTVLTQGAHITVEQRNELARSVLEQARRLQALTSDLLDLARLQDGAVKLQCEWCPAGELLRESITMVAGALQAHQLVADVADSDLVWCDPRLVSQAANNLLLNAAQHSPSGSRVFLQVRVAPGESWTLTVRDEGPGLTPGSEQAVFRKFHRDTDAESAQGTGLGLAICEVVARLHGGGVSARNEGGAVFEMVFPQPAHPPLPGD